MITIRSPKRYTYSRKTKRDKRYWYGLEGLEDRVLLSDTNWKSDTTRVSNYFWTDGNWTNGVPSSTKYAWFTFSPDSPVIMNAPPGDPAATIAGIDLTDGATVILTVNNNNGTGDILIPTDSSLTINGEGQQLTAGNVSVEDGELDVVETSILDCQNLEVAYTSDNGTLIVTDAARLNVHGHTFFGHDDGTAPGIATITFAGSAYVHSRANAAIAGAQYLDGNLERSSTVTVDGACWEVHGDGSLSVSQDCELAVQDYGMVSTIDTASGLQLAGKLSGDGVVYGNVSATSTGVLSPGYPEDPGGELLIQGDLDVSHGVHILTYLYDSDGGYAGAIVVSGTATMGGDLAWMPTNQFALEEESHFTPGQVFPILVANSFGESSFSSVSSVTDEMEFDFPLGVTHWWVTTTNAQLNGDPAGSGGYDLDTGSGCALILQAGHT